MRIRQQHILIHPISERTILILNIGNITLPKTAGLAPMAGVGDRAFREICKEFGCAYVVSEMASSKGLTFQGTKTEELLFLSEKERPAAIQLFGDDPQIMAEAAKLAMKFHPDVIDINMGCPAPKVAGNGGGSALMKNPPLAGQIVKAVCEAVEVPVTVKFRKGWDENSVNAVEFAKIMEENGAAALCIHGRTRSRCTPQRRLGDHPQGQGSRLHPGDGQRRRHRRPLLQADVRRDRGGLCDDRPRGAGQAWLFRQIDHYMRTGELLPDPTLEEKMEILLRHIRLLCDYKGEKIGMKEARKHAAWYFKGEHGSADFAAGQGSFPPTTTFYILPPRCCGADFLRGALPLGSKSSDLAPTLRGEGAPPLHPG